MEAIYTAVFFVTVIGVVCALVLCIASKFMYVKTDERIASLEEILPAVNCGACGYPGCSGYASALLSGSVKTDLCTPGGNDVLRKISAVLGIDAGSMEKKTAVVNCNGDSGAQKKKMEYRGIQSCEAAKSHYGGENSCAFGCLGYGDCKKVCPVSAICMKENLARVINENCTGCGLCVKACPVNIISIEKTNVPVIIACRNIEKGAVTRKKCSNGCIACSKCVKECPDGAISMKENLAWIDYEKCSGCQKCVNVCVTKCILRK